MTRWLLAMLALVGCVKNEVPDTDGETDTDDTGPGFACDYPELAGTWWGRLEETQPDNKPSVFWDTTMTLKQQGYVGEVIGTIHWEAEEVQPRVCDSRLVCIDEDQNEWTVIQELGFADCAEPGYWFLKSADDNTMAFEWGVEQFGERVYFGTLARQ